MSIQPRLLHYNTKKKVRHTKALKIFLSAVLTAYIFSCESVQMHKPADFSNFMTFLTQRIN